MKIMREVNGLKVYSHNDILDKTVGKIGSKERIKYEKKLEKELVKAKNKQDGKVKSKN